MLKKRKNQNYFKIPLSWPFPAGQSSLQRESFPKYPSDPTPIPTVRSKSHADVGAIAAFNYDPLDLAPSLTDSLRRSIGALDRFYIPNADVARGSLIEEARLTSSVSGERSAQIYGSLVDMHSTDPREDFRQSMEEMLEACHVDREEPLDWELLEELLYGYLEANGRPVYRYIFAAFFDLTAELGHRRSAECNCQCCLKRSL